MDENKIDTLLGSTRREAIVHDEATHPREPPAQHRAVRVPRLGLASFSASSGARCRAIGKGPALVVLLHGLGGSWRWWRPVISSLADGRRVVALDNPRGTRFSDLLQVVSGLIDELSHDPVDLVGHSFGGLVASLTAATRPDQVRRLVLVAPAGATPGRRLASWIAPLAESAVRTAPSHLPLIAYDALRTGPRSLWATGRVAARYDIGPFLDRIDAPTLVLWGDHDPLFPVGASQLFLERIRDSRRAVVYGAAHVPMVERPAAFLDPVLGFLAEDGPGGPTLGSSAASALSGRGNTESPI